MSEICNRCVGRGTVFVKWPERGQKPCPKCRPVDHFKWLRRTDQGLTNASPSPLKTVEGERA